MDRKRSSAFPATGTPRSGITNPESFSVNYADALRSRDDGADAEAVTLAAPDCEAVDGGDTHARRNPDRRTDANPDSNKCGERKPAPRANPPGASGRG